MILLISSYKNAPECAAQIEQATHDSVKTVDTLRSAQAALRDNQFTAVVADENLLECHPGSLDGLVQRMGTAIPVIVDMACLRPHGVAKHVVKANRRRQLEEGILRKQAIFELQSELKNDLTGILISTELALKGDGLSAVSVNQMNNIMEIARRIKSRLELA
ncbi:MAG TPA: hypothetical protein VN577_23570 [Terriglobales bacterium]|nr:hypothetical protein [Terriglobales bacterium]